MNSLNCLIVDDEPLSHDVLARYIQDVPGFTLESSCFNAIEAYEILHEKKIDLIFLDINMPKLSGISFVKTLENPPLIIFTTAYPQFAVEGFELDAVDYLVKPISFERFAKAINKAREQYEYRMAKEKEIFLNAESNKDFIILKSDKKIYKIDQSDILYIQSIGDYVKVFTKERVIIAAETLKHIESLLNDYFIRIHKSYIVSLNNINYIEGNQVKITDTFIPIGLTFKDQLLLRLNNKNLK